MKTLEDVRRINLARYIESAREKIERYSIPEPNSGCWLWERATNGRYGKLRFRSIGLQIYAHRASYAAHNEGRLPPVVMHKCDVPICVNPQHLVAGSHAANVADAIAKGRASKPPRMTGERHGRARLTWSDVAEIRNLDGVETCASMARRFGVGESTVRHILQGNTWRP